MKTLVKLTNNTLLYPTDTAVINGRTYGNMRHKDDYWISQGYKPLTGDPMPEDGKNYAPHYEDTPDAVVRTWVEIPDDERVLTLREEYRVSTRNICLLAGEEPVDKLEDAEYVPIIQVAMTVNPAVATLLSQTLMYTLFQLYRLDGGDAWERI